MRNRGALTCAGGLIIGALAGAMSIHVASAYGTYLAAAGAGMCLTGAGFAHRRALRVVLGLAACALCAAAIWHAQQITGPEATHPLPHIPANVPAQRI